MLIWCKTWSRTKGSLIIWSMCHFVPCGMSGWNLVKIAMVFVFTGYSSYWWLPYMVIFFSFVFSAFLTMIPRISFTISLKWFPVWCAMCHILDMRGRLYILTNPYTSLKGPFCDPKMLFLWHSSVDIDKISYLYISRQFWGCICMHVVLYHTIA